MVKYVAVVVMLALAAMNAKAEPAAETSSMEARIADLELKLKQLQEELAQQKQASATAAAPAATVAVADEAAINAAVSKALEKQLAEKPIVPEWVNNIKFNGDFRYRYEYTDDATKTADRNRNRIQARIGLVGKVNEEIDYGFRLASGNSEEPLGEGSATSHNQDLDNAFSSKNIWMDLAYFDYHPAGIKGLNVYGGKIENPYYRVGNSDLLFDTDITPEGIAAVYKTKLSDDLDVFGTAGGFSITERQTEADTSLWAVQTGLTKRFGAEGKSFLTAGGGYYDYGNVQGEEGLGSDAAQFYGNTTAGGTYASDFDVVQGFAEAGTPIFGDLPFRIFGDTVKNIRAESDEDTAWLAGASIGKTSKPGTWSFTYNYRDLEADALLGIFTEATFGGGGTNVKGHKYTLNYQLAKNTQLGLSYMDADRTRSGKTADYDVVFTDLTVKF
jgi:hypothetical protein